MVSYFIYRTFNAREQQPSLKEAAPYSAAPLAPKQIAIIKATVPVLQKHGTAITTYVLRKHSDRASGTQQRVQHSQPGQWSSSTRAGGCPFHKRFHIDEPGSLGPAVELICNKHASLYIHPDDYKIVGKYLLEAMKEVLGDVCIDNILDAWAAAYWALANIMIDRRGKLYKESEGWTNWRQFRVPRKRKIHFIHGSRSSQARAFKDHVQALEKKFPNMQVTFFTSTPSEHNQPGVDYHHLGRIDLQKLDTLADLHLDDPHTEFYICGPESFMAQIEGSLKTRGVGDDRIKMELFGTGGVPHN
ncbi:hypothetical protein CFD26_105259 [Aspergillus turcosus]|uniref:Globin domain-containing protein n=1 Tax=Aspergillus turcosus TaxID=1245748 RepID=A0A421D6Z3_9EURO|nr:hypothetical protein CFD26_105259 [Aspergillus turcosus]